MPRRAATAGESVLQRSWAFHVWQSWLQTLPLLSLRPTNDVRLLPIGCCFNYSIFQKNYGFFERITETTTTKIFDWMKEILTLSSSETIDKFLSPLVYDSSSGEWLTIQINSPSAEVLFLPVLSLTHHISMKQEQKLHYLTKGEKCWRQAMLPATCKGMVETWC